MVKFLICLMGFITCVNAEIESVESTPQSTSSTLSVLIAEFKSQYGVALSNPLNYSQKVNKPVLYLIYAPWSNTFQVFNRDAINDPVIYEYRTYLRLLR